MVKGKAPRKPPPKPREDRHGKPPPRNPRLQEQTRKILGKHYASKYRTR